MEASEKAQMMVELEGSKLKWKKKRESHEKYGGLIISYITMSGTKDKLDYNPIAISLSLSYVSCIWVFGVWVHGKWKMGA